MARIIALALQKGGVGKTTSCVTFAATLAQKGKKVLLIDFDSQGNASMCFGINPDNLERTIFSVIKGDCDIEEAIIKTNYGVDLLPANDDLSSLDMLIIENKDVFNRPAFVLSDEIKEIKDNYDYIFIDLPPSLSLITINGLTASSDVIIPMQCEYLATAGVNKLLKTIEKVRANYNPSLNLLGIFATMFNSRTNLSSVVLQEARKFGAKSNIKVFDSVISRSIRFSEAQMMGVPSTLFLPENEATKNYIRLTAEVFDL